MTGIENLSYGPSADESVHERWDTGSPSDWRVEDVGEVYAHLLDLNDGLGLNYEREQVWDDAELIWGWLQGSRG